MMKSNVIDEILYNERINSTQLAALINASLQSISSMKRRGLSKNYATKIKELYPKYSLQWLLTGEGSMYENNGDNIIQCAGNATHNTQNSNTINQELLGELIAQRKMFEEQINRLIGLLERK